MAWCPQGNKLDQDIFDALSEFVDQLLDSGEKLAGEFGVPVSALKAVHHLDGSVSMKELGRRLRCDPSFVTMIADVLEKRGLAAREPNTSDRRIKNLVLTAPGLELKKRLQQTLRAQMPWSLALDVNEREQLLGLIRKMIVDGFRPAPLTAEPEGAEVTEGTERTEGEVSGTPRTASPAAA